MTARRVLLDENITHKLRVALSAFETVTVQYAKFSGLKNGELLTAAEAEGFDVFVTADRSMEHEQNMSGRRIAIIALSAPGWDIIKDHTDEIAGAVGTALAGSITRIDCGRFIRQKRPPAQE